MKKAIIILLVITFPKLLFSQISDDFSDKNFSKNPTWIGNTDEFIVNTNGELQTNVSTSGSCFLSTRSEIIDDATWEFSVKREKKTSSGDYYFAVYLTSDRPDLTKMLYGYCVVIGGKKDKISLYKQQGGFSTKKELIEGKNKSVCLKAFEVDIKVTRSKDGKFELFRKIKGQDSTYVKEGSAIDNSIKTSHFFGVLAKHKAKSGKDYFFDNIKIKGKIIKDTTPPELLSVNVEAKDTMNLLLNFSEVVNIKNATFQVNNEMGNIISKELQEYGVVVNLGFSKKFEQKKIYQITVKNLTDYYGNKMEETKMLTGIAQKMKKGDLVINEILFNPQKDIPEFLEIYNTSDKLLDLGSIYFGTNPQKNKNKYEYKYKIPNQTLIVPHGYVAITTDRKTLKKEFNTPKSANIVPINKKFSFTNDGTNIYIINKQDKVIYDEVDYSSKWHHPTIRDDKGVSLEKINPLFDSNSPTSWHSASFDVNYGTPGYKNSQYVENPKENNSKKTKVWVEPEAFSPDNDGIQDVCFIKYKAEDIGNTANIIIFTSTGLKVKQIASNHLLSDKGYFVWDGKTDRDKNINPGIYVLYFEIINTTTGSKKVEKMPIVVSAR